METHGPNLYFDIQQDSKILKKFLNTETLNKIC